MSDLRLNIDKIKNSITDSLMRQGMDRVIKFYNEADNLKGFNDYQYIAYVSSRKLLDDSEKFKDGTKDMAAKRVSKALAQRFDVKGRDYTPAEIDDWVMEQLVRKKFFPRMWMVRRKRARQAILQAVIDEMGGDEK